MTCIGELNRQLVLEQLQMSDDGVGGSDATWITIATLWAKLRPHLGNEIVTGEAVTSQITHLVTIRYRSDIKPSMRFRDGNRVFDILSLVDPKEAGTWLVCRCAEKITP